MQGVAVSRGVDSARYSVGMTPDVIAAIVAALLAIVGVVGIIVPVLPGSILVGVGLLVWAIWGGGWAWLAFAIGIVFVAVGAISGWVLTKRNLDQRQIPNWPVLVGFAAGVVGIFILPAFGLPIGFIIGLVVAELVRLRGDWQQALSTSWLAVKTLGVGILIEFAAASVAIGALSISIVAHFLTR